MDNNQTPQENYRMTEGGYTPPNNAGYYPQQNSPAPNQQGFYQQQPNYPTHPVYPTQQGTYPPPPPLVQPAYTETYAAPDKPKKQKKLKKKHGCLFRFFRFLLIVALIIGVIIGAIFGWQKYQEHKALKELEDSLLVMESNYDIDIEELKETPSDIEGMSVYDKAEQGLYPYEGSDTDGDGLTDKEEIEIYGTDPLKASTSGDMIPDSIKVMNGLDVNSTYSYEEADFSPTANFPEITLNNLNTENCLTSIYEIEGYSIEGIPVIKAIAIDNYNGKITIDVTEYAQKANNLVAFCITDAAGSEYEQLKIKNNEIAFDTKGLNYIICLMDINTDTIQENISIDDFTAEALNGNEALIITYPITALSGSTEIHIVEKSELFSDDNSDARAKTIQQYLLQHDTENELGSSVTVNHTYVDSVGFNMLNGVLDFITGGDLYESILAENNVEGGEIDTSVFRSIIRFFIQYTHVGKTQWDTMLQFHVLNNGSVNGGEIPEQKEKPSEYVSSFDIAVDAFSFSNLGTTYSEASMGGNCAGISAITAQLFNKNTYPRVLEGVYDLSDEEFDTLFDKGLYDFKNYGYWENTYTEKDEGGNFILDQFSENDIEFIKFLGHIHYVANTSYSPTPMKFEAEYSWDAIEALMEYLASGDKIATVGMIQPFGGHRVVAYGIEQDKDNPYCYYILLYDNNFPVSVLENFGYDTKDIKIKIVKKTTITGKKIFSYDYNPINSSSYRFTSEVHKTKATTSEELFLHLFGAHSLTFYDENTSPIYVEEID